MSNEDRAVRYHRLKRRVAVASLLLTAGALAVLLVTGASVAARELLQGLVAGGPSSPATVAAYSLALVLGLGLLDLPLSWYGGSTLERRYGLSTDTPGGWLRDHAKGAAVEAALAVAGASLVYHALRTWPSAWWVLSAGAFAAIAALLSALAPVVLMPLFYRFAPLDRPSLSERLMDLSTRAGVPVLGAYVWGLGEKTRRANAALVGTGATRRILLSDTLLADYTEDEIEVVLAHEMAHHVHRDIPKALLVELLVLLAAFGAAAQALAAWWEPLGLAAPDDVAGLPLLVLTGGAVMLAVTPAVHALSRRNEYRADRFAVELTGRPEAFAAAMRRLAAQNMAEERPSRLALWLFHTHPPIPDRIAAVRATTRALG